MGEQRRQEAEGLGEKRKTLTLSYFCLNPQKLLRKAVRKPRLVNSHELCRHINAPGVKALLFVPEVKNFSTNPHLKTSRNQALFERKVALVHLNLKEPTSTPVSPSVLTNEIKSERANCMCGGSWEALWSQWWRSDVVILFRSVDTNVFHGLHLCRLWFTRSQRVVFELLGLITATSPDSLKIRAVFKIVEEKLNNCPQANMNQPCLPLTSSLHSRSRVGSFPVRDVRMRQHRQAGYNTADWPQFQIVPPPAERARRVQQGGTHFQQVHSSRTNSVNLTGVLICVFFFFFF